MNFKKIMTAVMAFCVIAGTPVAYTCKNSINTAYADSGVNMGSITLDNEHPTAVPTISGISGVSGSGDFSWYTSDENVAIVDEKGKITAVGKGNCIISAYCRENDTPYYINVTSNYEPVEQDVTEITDIQMSDIMFTNSEVTKQIVFNAPSDIVITYSSTDESIATVDGNGLVTAKGMGKCQIIAVIENTRYIFNVTSVYTGVATGAIDIGTLNLTEKSAVQTITISGVPQDMPITWSSSDESIAVVSRNGVVSGIKKGSCIVYAEIDGKKYAMNINVEFDVEDIMQTFEVNKNAVLLLSYSNMADDVVFTSSDENTAVVDSSGKVTAKNVGETVIKAESSSGIVFTRVKVIDKSENLIGDANCDGNVNMSDATAIIQHIGNRDKYGLTGKGLSNADTNNDGQVTTDDAIAIQMLIAGMIDSFTQS